MPFALKKIIVAAHQNKTFNQLAELPVSALKGVSPNDALLLDQSLGIKTIGDLGENKFFSLAQSIYRASRDDEFDLGPQSFWNSKLSELPDSYYINHPSNRFRVHFGGVPYRGRLDSTAKVIIIGQDPSTDEALARRAFVGDAGQRLQKLLHKIGITRSYIIINTFAYSINGQANAEMRAIAQESVIKTYREDLLNTFIERNPIEAIITLGAGSREAINTWSNPNNITIHNLFHPSARQGLVDNWNNNLASISSSITPDDPTLIDLSQYTGQWTQSSHRMDIPRFDLPYNTPFWHGTNGTNSERGPNRVSEITWTSIL